MATTKKRTADVDQAASQAATVTVEDFDALQQEQDFEQAARKQKSHQFLAECVPVLAAGQGVDKATLQEGLELTGMTLDQLEQHATDYRRMGELQAELAKHDREALIAEMKQWQHEAIDYQLALKQRLTERRGLLGQLSATSQEIIKLRTQLRAAGILPMPEAPADGYKVVSGGQEFIDPREPLAEKDSRFRRNMR